MLVELSLNNYLTATHNYDMCIMERDNYGSLIFYDKETIKQMIAGLKMLLEENE